jgi:hypothetical protein
VGLIDHLDLAGAKGCDERHRRDARRGDHQVSRGVREGAFLRLKFFSLTGAHQWHSKDFPARSISDNDLLTRDVSRALVPGKFPGHPDCLLHGIHKGRQILAIDILQRRPASEAEVERWHARHPCTALRKPFCSTRR